MENRVRDTALLNGKYCDLCNKYGARKAMDYTIIIDAPPFVASARREEVVLFWSI